MNKIRCFISIDIDPPVKKIIKDFVSFNLKQHIQGRVRWVNPDNLHLTLSFLGDISKDMIPLVKDAIKKVSMESEPFKIELSDLGCFPNFQNPRVLWIGIKEQPILHQIKRNIDRELDNLGVAYDKKSFSPHLTIGRIKGPVKMDWGNLKALDFKAFFIVREILFMESRLYPEGPVYNQIFGGLLTKSI